MEVNVELERDSGLEIYKPEPETAPSSEPEPEPSSEHTLTLTLTLRELVAEQLAGWMDAGVEYIYEDGDANPPLIYLYDALECPNLHRELDRLVVECERVTFVFGLEFGLGGITPSVGFACAGDGDGISSSSSSSSSSAASNRQPNDAESEEADGDNADDDDDDDDDGDGEGEGDEIKGIAAANSIRNETQVLHPAAAAVVAVAANARGASGSLQRQPPQLHIRFADGGTVWLVPDGLID